MCRSPLEYLLARLFWIAACIAYSIISFLLIVDPAARGAFEGLPIERHALISSMILSSTCAGAAAGFLTRSAWVGAAGVAFFFTVYHFAYHMSV
jgi:hypothetical protein